MGLRISGKGVDVGEAYRSHIEGRLGEALEKYFDGGFTGHVTIEHDGPGFRADCAIHLDTGIVLKSEGRSHDVRQSFEIAADRIEKRLRRYKRRLKEHHHKPQRETTPAIEYVIAAPTDESEAAAGQDPVVIAEQTTDLQTMTVGTAVMTMDLTEATVVVFRNAGHGGVNVVYRRADGHIGWIDPTLAADGGNAKH